MALMSSGIPKTTRCAVDIEPQNTSNEPTRFVATRMSVPLRTTLASQPWGMKPVAGWKGSAILMASTVNILATIGYIPGCLTSPPTRTYPLEEDETEKAAETGVNLL